MYTYDIFCRLSVSKVCPLARFTACNQKMTRTRKTENGPLVASRTRRLERSLTATGAAGPTFTVGKWTSNVPEKALCPGGKPILIESAKTAGVHLGFKCQILVSFIILAISFNCSNHFSFEHYNYVKSNEL